MSYTNKRGDTKSFVATALPVEIKQEFKDQCEARGLTVSQALRSYIYAQVGKPYIQYL
ncbi:MAG: hypothetical protein AAFQ80_15195 [Cyanobacteria bacterium J06621_8]